MRDEGRREKGEGRREKEEGQRKKEEGRRKKLNAPASVSVRLSVTLSGEDPTSVSIR
jgi:hypothetical protein